MSTTVFNINKMSTDVLEDLNFSNYEHSGSLCNCSTTWLAADVVMKNGDVIPLKLGMCYQSTYAGDQARSEDGQKVEDVLFHMEEDTYILYVRTIVREINDTSGREYSDDLTCSVYYSENFPFPEAAGNWLVAKAAKLAVDRKLCVSRLRELMNKIAEMKP